jgi:hypothetical protein
MNYLPGLVSNLDPTGILARISGVNHCARHHAVIFTDISHTLITIAFRGQRNDNHARTAGIANCILGKLEHIVTQL